MIFLLLSIPFLLVNDLTVIVFGEASLEAVQFPARHDRLPLHVRVALDAVH